MKPLAAALIGALLLGGCGSIAEVGSSVLPATGAAPPTALKDFPPTASARLLWQADAGSSAGRDYVRISPSINATSVFVAGGRSASAWDKSNGARLWQTPLDGDITGGTSNGEGNIYLGTDGGNAIALDSQTGAVRWHTRLGSEVLAVSATHNGRVAFRTSDGHLHGLSTQTGEQRWEQARPNPNLSLRGAGTPIVVGGMVIAGFDNGAVSAFDMDSGTALWEATLAIPRGNRELDQVMDVDGKLKPVGEALFAASYNGQVAGINMRTGEIGWAAPYSTYTGVEADSNGLYSTNAEGDVWKLNPQNGSPVWKLPDLERRHPSAPTVMGNYLVVGDQAGYLHWINAADGQLAARLRGDSAGYASAPVLDGGSLYALGRGGTLSAITLSK